MHNAERAPCPAKDRSLPAPRCPPNRCHLWLLNDSQGPFSTKARNRDRYSLTYTILLSFSTKSMMKEEKLTLLAYAASAEDLMSTLWVFQGSFFLKHTLDWLWFGLLDCMLICSWNTSFSLVHLKGTQVTSSKSASWCEPKHSK